MPKMKTDRPVTNTRIAMRPRGRSLNLGLSPRKHIRDRPGGSTTPAADVVYRVNRQITNYQTPKTERKGKSFLIQDG